MAGTGTNPKTYEAVLADLSNKKLTQVLIAKKHAVSASYVSNVARGISIKQPRHDAAISRREDLIKNYRQERSELQKLITTLSKELTAYKQAAQIKDYIAPETFQIKSKSLSDATAFALIGDWHIDEIVDPREVSGVNEFNDIIAVKRVDRLFTTIISLLEMCQSRSKIDTLVLTLLGDFISGWIHPDLVESNELTPPEAVIRMFDLLIGGIDFLLKHTKVDLIISGSIGNHSRITERFRTKKRAEKSFEWIVYEFLVRWYAAKGEKRIKFVLPKGNFNWLKVYDQDIRIHHGDAIRYQGGIGGVEIPLKKAIAQWNKARRADIDILGHWHARKTSSEFCINGSLIGYSQFAETIKADYEPPSQSFFILRPMMSSNGALVAKTAEFPIIL